MASYQPPSENLPIFNPSVFATTETTGLTLEQANALYVHYPYAQGTVNFPDIEVSNNAMVDNDLVVIGSTTSGDIISENSLVVAGSTTLGMGAVTNPLNATNVNLNSTYTYLGTDISGLTGVDRLPAIKSINGQYMAVTANSDSNNGVFLYNTAVDINSSNTLFSFRRMTGTGAYNDVLLLKRSGRLDFQGDGYINFTTASGTPYIKYKDNTQQNTAYTGAGALAGSYTLSNITIDANGKITAIANGTGGGGGDAVLANNQTFTGLNTFSQVLTGTVGAVFGTNQPTDAVIFKSAVYSTSGASTNPLIYGNDVSTGTYTDNAIPSRKYNDARYISGTNNNTFTGIQSFTSTVEGSNNTTPILYPNTITTFTSPQSIINKAYSDAAYLPLTGSPTTNASYTFTSGQAFNGGFTAGAANACIFNGGLATLKTCQIGGNNPTDYLSVRAPVYTDAIGSTKPLSYLNDVSTYTPLTDNMIMNKKYIDNIVGTSSNLSITSLTTSAAATIGTNLQVNGNTVLGDGLGTDTTSINGNIYGATNTTPLSYPNTVTTFSSSTQNIPSIAYTNANYASLTGNNTMSGIQTITGVVQGDATGVNSLTYAGTVTNFSSNQSITDKGYNDTNYLRLAAVTQTAAGTYTFSNPPTMSGANISASSIPNSALANGSLYMTTTSAQTVSGAKNFTTAPTLSGANITAATIPTSALVDTFLTTGANTYTGVQSYASTVQGTNSTTAISYSATVSTAAITAPKHIPTKEYCDQYYLNSQITGSTQTAGNSYAFTGTNTHTGSETFSGALNANNGVTVNSNIMLSSVGVVWGKNYREKLAAATINTAGTVYTIDWVTSGVSTLNVPPTANFTLNIWNVTMSSTQTTVMTLSYNNINKFRPSTINFYSDSGTTSIPMYIAWLGGVPTIASATFTDCTFSIYPAGVLDLTANNICKLTLCNYY